MRVTVGTGNNTAFAVIWCRFPAPTGRVAIVLEGSACEGTFLLTQQFVCLCFCAAELIKKHELGKDELRPLYMDFQATTPMVRAPPLPISRGGTRMERRTFVYILLRHQLPIFFPSSSAASCVPIICVWLFVWRRFLSCGDFLSGLGPPGAGRHAALPGELLRQPSLQDARLRLGE